MNVKGQLNQVSVLDECEGTVEPGICTGQLDECEAKFADLADLISGNRAVESLSREQIYRYYTKHFIPSDDESLFTKMIQKKDKKYTLTYQLK